MVVVLSDYMPASASAAPREGQTWSFGKANLAMQ
jgi:hypothetical protein